MSDYGSLHSLVSEIRQASENISDADARTGARLDGIERSLNELYIKTQRPGGYSGDCNDASFDTLIAMLRSDALVCASKIEQRNRKLDEMPR